MNKILEVGYVETVRLLFSTAAMFAQPHVWNQPCGLKLRERSSRVRRMMELRQHAKGAEDAKLGAL